MQKFFVENEKIKENEIIITGTDVNHILNVLRLKENDKIQVCDKQNAHNYIVKILKYDKEKIITQIVKEEKATIESDIIIDVYQGLPKADKMELIIQKTTEIGVNKIIPVQMERSIVKIDQKACIKKIERWQKIAEVAAKQSKRDIIPQVENIIDITKLIDKIKEYNIFIIAYEEEKDLTLKNILKEVKKEKRPIKIGFLIGPEGGIDNKEIEKFKKTNAKIITLGKRILRTETAPIVLSSNIMYELENEE